MRLYLNDALINPKPEAGDVLAAFENLRACREARLELRRGPSSSLSVSREAGLGFTVALHRPDGVFGVCMDELFAEQVAGALREYLDGQKPALVSDDLYEPDCPLCAAMAAAHA
ncbi:MAG: hypothetical protein NTY77_19145 [Elusimicrobia bacterium]|nr:hypothetical protein [Elusimicrobiota bacterium]